MTETKNKPNKLELWDAVCKTDPNYTKNVSYGPRKFTAIDAQYQILNATKQWGSYGSTWGVKGMQWNTIEQDGKIAELTLDAVFFYPGGEFEISTDIKYAPGGECRKKCQTDLTTKALSKLGFNADVFLGAFDGNRTDGNGAGAVVNKNVPRMDIKESAECLEKYKSAILGCKTVAELDKYSKGVKGLIVQMTDADQNAVSDYYSTRKEELNGAN